METAKWPKVITPLSDKEKDINDDFMKHWHKQLGTSWKYRVLEFFNHGYPKSCSPKDFQSTLEIGAGLGEHIAQQHLNEEQLKNYVALELRDNMADSIKKRFPTVNTCVGDCQEHIPFDDNHFDRIIASHVLEHLPNLPAAVAQMHRVCNKEKGKLLVVIPCEGGLLHRTLRKITSQRTFEKRYNTAYAPFIAREHCNVPHEILTELKKFFTIDHSAYYPTLIPSVDTNILIGLTLTPKL